MLRHYRRRKLIKVVSQSMLLAQWLMIIAFFKYGADKKGKRACDPFCHVAVIKITATYSCITRFSAIAHNISSRDEELML